MRYIEIETPGGPEALQLRKGEIPAVQRGKILIKVHAAGLNGADIMQRQGEYPPPPGASPILGLEVAGEIDAMTEGVSEWRVGDRVCALVNGGGYAEYATAPAGQCLPIPGGLSFEQAAGLPETCFTVWINVFSRAALKAGESFLVHGGAGGIGTTAIQMARALGARVFATAGSEEKVQACLDLGAEVAVNYRRNDFVEAVREATGGKGVDVILDMVGGDYIERNMAAAAIDGRIINIAFRSGSVAKVDFLPMMLKRLTLTGSTLRPMTAETKARIADDLRDRVWPLIEAGEIKPLIAASFALKDAAKAHRLMESGEHIGKIILRM